MVCSVVQGRSSAALRVPLSCVPSTLDSKDIPRANAATPIEEIARAPPPYMPMLGIRIAAAYWMVWPMIATIEMPIVKSTMRFGKNPRIMSNKLRGVTTVSRIEEMMSRTATYMTTMTTAVISVCPYIPRIQSNAAMQANAQPRI